MNYRMTDAEILEAFRKNAAWWRERWKSDRMNDVQPAVVLDDVMYWLEHRDAVDAGFQSPPQGGTPRE